MAEQQQQPGWYPIPTNLSEERYWNGREWTETRPAGSIQKAADEAPPAGWYPDPEQVQTQRYWTGTEWTDQRAPMAPPPPKKESGVWIGVVLAILFPLIGFIFGLVMLFRGFVSGLAVILLSMFAGLFWTLVLVAV